MLDEKTLKALEKMRRDMLQPERCQNAAMDKTLPVKDRSQPRALYCGCPNCNPVSM